MEFTEHQKNLIYRFYFGIIALNEGGKRFSKDYSGIRRALRRVISESTIADYDKQALSEQEQQEWQKMLQTFERLVDYSNCSRLPNVIFKLVVVVAIAAPIVAFLVYGLKSGAIMVAASALLLILCLTVYYLVRITTWARGFSPLMLGLTHVECDFALRELIQHERWNKISYATNGTTIDSHQTKQSNDNINRSESRAFTEDELTIGNEILRVYSQIPLDSLGVPPLNQYKQGATQVFAKSGYVARLAEEEVVGHRELNITAEHREFLKRLSSDKDKIMKLAEHLEQHSIIGIGEPVKSYVLTRYGVMRAVLDSVMKDTKERLSKFILFNGRDDELWHRVVAFGYVYKIAQELCDALEKNKRK